MRFARPMQKRSFARLVFLAGILSTGAGCAPSPDEVCTHYNELRRKEDLPSNAEIHKACVKEVETAVEKLPEAQAVTRKCIATATSVDDAEQCASRAAKGKERDKAYDLWPYGIAADAAGAWADEKEPLLDDDACHEGARLIARKKVRNAIIDAKEEKEHAKDLLKACKEQGKNATYAKTFACLRKADDENDIIGCSTATADAAKASLIEGCYKKCKAEHGDSSSYMPCFTSCRDEGGI